MITNGNYEAQKEKIRNTSLGDCFEMILISGEIGIHKPDERVFLEATKRMNVLPEECLYIGDALVNDIEGSTGVGMKAIWIYPNVKKRTNLPCQRIYRIQDLMEIL